MPVTITPTPHKVGTCSDTSVNSPLQLLAKSSKAWTIDPKEQDSEWVQTNKKKGPEDRQVLQSSFHELNSGQVVIVPYGNGFVDGIIRAFNQDLHLVLRPDDVWLAILTQFSMYVNGHAEELRSLFVEHRDKKVLTVSNMPAPLHDTDMGKMAHIMTKEIQKYVIDSELQQWMIPNFSTTTDNDVAVASFVMMGGLQKYFEYVIMMGCGFPSVTLLGEKSDWQALITRAEQLPRYGEEPGEWSILLLPILRRMVQTFDDPTSEGIKDFWLRTCYEAGADGSGNIATLSGWITAFCFWTEDGKLNQAYTEENLVPVYPGFPSIDRKPLTLDGVRYPLVRPNSVPKAFVTVPVKLEDYGDSVRYETTVVAGHVGVTLAGEGTIVQPRSGWWMLVDSKKSME